MVICPYQDWKALICDHSLKILHKPPLIVSSLCKTLISRKIFPVLLVLFHVDRRLLPFLHCHISSFCLFLFKEEISVISLKLPSRWDCWSGCHNSTSLGPACSKAENVFSGNMHKYYTHIFGVNHTNQNWQTHPLLTPTGTAPMASSWASSFSWLFTFVPHRLLFCSHLRKFSSLGSEQGSSIQTCLHLNNREALWLIRMKDHG